MFRLVHVGGYKEETVDIDWFLVPYWEIVFLLCEPVKKVFVIDQSLLCKVV